MDFYSRPTLFIVLPPNIGPHSSKDLTVFPSFILDFTLIIVQYSLQGKYTNGTASTAKTHFFQDKHGQRITAV